MADLRYFFGKKQPAFGTQPQNTVVLNSAHQDAAMQKIAQSLQQKRTAALAGGSGLQLNIRRVYRP
jgi:hypothetical protein